MIKNPFYANFERFSSYLLDEWEECTFLEWLVINQAKYGVGKYFYCSMHRIQEKTKISRRRQNACIALFKSMGFLSTKVMCEKGGNRKVKHFKVDYEILKESKVLGKIVEKGDNYNAWVNYLENPYALKKERRNDIMDILNEVYQERVDMYNKGELTDEKPKRKKLKARLPTNKTIIQRLNEMAEKYNDNSVKKSFLAFSDSILKGEQEAKHIMANFVTYQAENDSYPVMEYYLNVYITRYGSDV